MFIFTSTLHTIYTELKNKVALSSADDKRYIIPGGINTLAWGHYQIAPYDECAERNLDVFLQLAQDIFEEDKAKESAKNV